MWQRLFPEIFRYLHCGQRTAMATIQGLEKLETLQKVVDFLGSWQERGKRESLVNTFFRLVREGKKSGAKAVLEKIKERSESSMWRQGYINALEGMVVASETKDDRDVFINHVRVESSDELRRKFFQQSRNELHAEFDRGFFAAWAEYMQALKQTAKPT